MFISVPCALVRRCTTAPDPENPKAKNQALLDSAHSPALFASIFQRWKNRPSEVSLQSYLAHEGFNTNSVGQVARAFYDTYDLVSDFLSSYDSASSTPLEVEDDEEENDMDATPIQPADAGGGRRGAKSIQRQLDKASFRF